jgi:superfamily II DNA or RNA helicase
MASIIEAKHRRLQNVMIDLNGYLNDEALDIIEDIVRLTAGPVLVFANHATIAAACEKSLADPRSRFAGKVTIVTGDTPAKKKAARIAAFRDGVLDVMVGTASLATGTDGLDKVCDTLIILDDTDDDSLRRQLIGRIMPRGADADASKKQVYRIVPTWT